MFCHVAARCVRPNSRLVTGAQKCAGRETLSENSLGFSWPKTVCKQWFCTSNHRPSSACANHCRFRAFSRENESRGAPIKRVLAHHKRLLAQVCRHLADVSQKNAHWHNVSQVVTKDGLSDKSQTSKTTGYRHKGGPSETHAKCIGQVSLLFFLLERGLASCWDACLNTRGTFVYIY